MSRSIASNGSTRSTQLDLIANFCIQPHAEKKAYKQDKKCTVCFEAFTVGKKKKYCKFCYRGVCNKCAERNAFHPERNERLRLCDNCYRRGMEEFIKQDFERQLMKEMSEVDTQDELLRNQRKLNITKSIFVNELKEKYQQINSQHLRKDAELRNQIEDLNRDIIQLEKKGVLLKQQFEKKKVSLQKKQGKIKTAKEQLQSILVQQSVGTSTVENLQELIDIQHQENQKLIQKLTGNKLENTQQECKLENLPIQVQKASEQIKDAQIQKKSLAKQINVLEEQKESKKHDILLLSQQIQNKRSFAQFFQSELGSDVDFERVIQYFTSTAANQQREIKRIKKQLTNINKPLDYDDQTLPVRSRCYCLIQ